MSISVERDAGSDGVRGREVQSTIKNGSNPLFDGAIRVMIKVGQWMQVGGESRRLVKDCWLFRDEIRIA